MSSRKSSPLPQGRFLLWISTIWCGRNGGVKLHQCDLWIEAKRFHGWFTPPVDWARSVKQWSCGGLCVKLKQFAHFLKGCCDANLFQTFFFLFKGHFFTQILTWWNMGFMEWWLEFLVWYPSQWKQHLHTHKTLSKFMANLTNAMVETKQQGIEEYDLTFSRYWCLIFGLSVLYLTLTCTTGKNYRFSTGVRIEAPFTKLHGFIDTLEGETARELEDSMTISGWSSTKAINLGHNLHICKLNSELVYPRTVMISKRKGCSSNHDLYIYKALCIFLPTWIVNWHHDIPFRQLLKTPAEQLLPVPSVTVASNALLRSWQRRRKPDVQQRNSTAKEGRIFWGLEIISPRYKSVLIFIFESWYISHKDYPVSLEM